jgi:hypothetical protein
MFYAFLHDRGGNREVSGCLPAGGKSPAEGKPDTIIFFKKIVMLQNETWGKQYCYKDAVLLGHYIQFKGESFQ